jgi:hypothetical protein
MRRTSRKPARAPLSVGDIVRLRSRWRRRSPVSLRGVIVDVDRDEDAGRETFYDVKWGATQRKLRHWGIDPRSFWSADTLVKMR